MEDTTVEQPRQHGGRRQGAGRRASAAPKSDGQTVSVWLTAEDVAYLETVSPGNKSLAVREILERSRKMWPKG